MNLPVVAQTQIDEDAPVDAPVHESSQSELLARYQNSLTQVFGAPSRVLVRGKGSWVWDAEGNQYLDMLGGIAVNVLGHAHPEFSAIMAGQLATLGQISNFFTSVQQISLAEKLLSLVDAPAGSSVFLSNSGSEANEAALKIARAYARKNRQKHDGAGPTTVVALKGGFHGRTLGALSLTHKAAYREPFEPLLGPVVHIEPNDLAALEEHVNQDCVALILEPIQGEAGVYGLDGEFVRAARALTRKYGALLIDDEVQSGVGRTGAWLAYPERYREGAPNLVMGPEDLPDIITLAKGLGAGVPIGASICIGEKVSGAVGAGEHGTTFGGNPLASTAALATLHILEKENLLEHARDMGSRLAAQVSALEGVSEVRGYGLLIGITLDQPVAATVQRAALDAGLIVNAARPDVIRIAPPLNLSAEEADIFLDRFAALLATVRGSETETLQPTSPTSPEGGSVASHASTL